MVTNTIPLKEENKKIKVLSVASLFSDIMKQHVNLKSIKQTFFVCQLLNKKNKYENSIVERFSKENVGKKVLPIFEEREVFLRFIWSKEQIHFFIPENEAKKLVFTPNVYLIEMDIQGKKYKAILQENPITSCNG